MSFISQMFSSDNSASYGRFASFLALVCTLIWASIINGKTNVIPDIPANWLLVICIPFGVSKVGETINAVWGKIKEVKDESAKLEG